MKKYFLYIITLALFIVSCKKNDPIVDVISPPIQNYILPKSITIINANGTFTSTFSYNGNKLVSIVGTSSIVSYTYTGNLVTKITSTNSAPNESLNIEDFVYNIDNTISSIATYYEYNNSGQTIKSKNIIRYIYNVNGTINQRNYNIDINNGLETPDNYSVDYTFTNGNITKGNNINYNSFNLREQIFEYDLKNSPYKNVLGYNKLFKERSNTNNLLKRILTDTIYFNGQTIVTSDIQTRTYVYNSDNFPTEIKNFNSSGTLLSTTQFTY